MQIINYTMPLSEDSPFVFLLTEYIRNQVIKIADARIFCMHCPAEILILFEQSLTEEAGVKAYNTADLIYKTFRNNQLVLELLAPDNIQDFTSAMHDLELSNQIIADEELPPLTF